MILSMIAEAVGMILRRGSDGARNVRKVRRWFSREGAALIATRSRSP